MRHFWLSRALTCITEDLIYASGPSRPTASGESGLSRRCARWTAADALPPDPGRGPWRPAGQLKRSNWTTSPVQSDRTDTPNLEEQDCPVGCSGRVCRGSDRRDDRSADESCRSVRGAVSHCDGASSGSTDCRGRRLSSGFQKRRCGGLFEKGAGWRPPAA
jgi:hypothetical protein